MKKYLDKTRNERQSRRRMKEKEWLKQHGFNSWEALHTLMMKVKTRLTLRAVDEWRALAKSDGESNPAATRH